jgi:hypothetical protein
MRAPVIVLRGDTRFTRDALAERAVYLAEQAEKTADPVLRQARLQAASALNLEVLKRFPAVFPFRGPT